MRENRLYGSEGGAGVLSLRSYPYRSAAFMPLQRMFCSGVSNVYARAHRRSRLRARRPPAGSWRTTANRHRRANGLNRGDGVCGVAAFEWIEQLKSQIRASRFSPFRLACPYLVRSAPAHDDSGFETL